MANGDDKKSKFTKSIPKDYPISKDIEDRSHEGEADKRIAQYFKEHPITKGSSKSGRKRGSK